MARTERNIYYPDDYNEVADIPADLQTMAESIDDAIDGAVQEATYDDTALKARVTATEGDISDIKAEQTQQNTDIQTNANAIQTLQGTVTAQGQSIEGLSNNKVDKVQGKGLSTEDFETAEKAKLAGIEAEANKTIVDSSLDDTSTNPVQNKVIYESQEEQNAEIEVLQQDVEDLRGACLSVEGTGTDITLSNTAKGRLLKNELGGRTEQEQLSGKNLFSGDYSQFDSIGGQGTTYAYFKLPDENKRYILTMTAKEDFTPTNTTYIGMTRNGGNADGAYQWLIDGNYGQTIVKGRTISLYSNVNSKNLQFVSLFSKSSETLKKFTDKFDIQLEEGDTSTTYEPYCRRNTSTKFSVTNALLKM